MREENPVWVDGACRKLLREVRRVLRYRQPPILVALDGGSGAGKSTLAQKLVERLEAADISATHVPMDDFYAAYIPDWAWDDRSVAERARDAFDWQRLRTQALEPLLAGKPAKWHPFDFVGGLRADGTYGMSEDYVTRDPASVIILDGNFSTRPELRDLIDLRVLVDVPVEVRHRRTAAREEADFLARWHMIWDAVEVYHLTVVSPKSSFDVVVSGGIQA